MSKRTSTIRNSPPSSSPMHKKRKTTNYSTPEITSSLPLEVDSAIGSSNPDIISLLKGSTPSNNGKETPSLGGSSAPIKDGHSPPVQADANGWTKVEKRKEKKAKKVAQKALNEPPSFAFNVQQLAKMQTVAISDIRELALHLTGCTQAPDWLRILNRTSIRHIVFLLVPGVTPDVFTPPLQPQPNTSNPLLHVPAVSQTNPTGDPSSKLPFLSTFLHAVPTIAPGDTHRMFSVLHGFFVGPATGEEKKRRIAERIKDERDITLPISSYILTAEQLLDNEYPVPNWMSEASQLGDNWIQVPEHSGNEPDRVLALDCEMCITTAGKELTHICIVDYDTGEKIYDELVLPSAPITDYLTRFSGITASSLEFTTTRLSDVHAFLKPLLTPNTILLGHSLESDLYAMKVAHGRCLDTSVLYHHPRGRPLKPGLKWLMNKWANRDIQTRGEGGHDPEEDARACIDLMKLKLKNGKGFGHFMVDAENMLERMARSGGKGVKTAVVDYGKPNTWLGAKATSTVACTSDEDVVTGVKEMVHNHLFVFGRMLELSEGLGWSTKKPNTNQNAGTPPATPAVETPASLETSVTPSRQKTPDELYKSLNDNLKSIYSALPAMTAFVLFSGHGDPRRMAELSTKRAAFETMIREGKATADILPAERWTAQEGRLLEDEVEKAKRGLLFLGIK